MLERDLITMMLFAGLFLCVYISVAPYVWSVVQNFEKSESRILSSTANISSVELSALEDLYNGNGGEHWGWQSDEYGIPWNFSESANPCTDGWQGIQCALPPPQDMYYVTNLSLPLLQLINSLPESLGHLQHLRYLNFYGNYLSGTLSASFLNMTGLEVLNVSSNQFVGTIPDNLGIALANLSSLQLSNNKLSGTVPSTLKNLTRLETLELAFNTLSGQLHGSFCSESQVHLKIVALNDNIFTGTLPDSLLRNSNLQMLSLDTNCFHGTVSDSICRNVNLEVLTLGCLHTAPACVNPVLRGFDSSNGGFVVSDPVKGSIPSCLFELPKLQMLALLGNALTGSLPSNTSSSHNLTNVLLSHNALTGTIPMWLQRLNLHYLDLSYNALDGYFHGRDSYTKSQTLDLRYNYISGNIPSNVQKLKQVEILSGNIFACDQDHSDLPRTDSAHSYYQCGSDDYNKPMYLWLSTVAFAVAVICLLIYCRQCDAYVNFQSILVYAKFWLIVVRDTKLSYISEVRKVGKHITSVGLICAICITFIGAPVYAILTRYYGTFTLQYAWTVSLVLLAGVWPFVVGVILLFLALITFTVTFARPSKLASIVADHAHTKAAPTTYTVVLVCSLYFFINLSFPVIANAYYLTLVVRSPSLQITMSAYKLVWNSIISPYLSRWLVFKLMKHRADFFTLELFVALLSNVIIPLLCVVFFTPQCFYGAFEANGYRLFLFEYNGVEHARVYGFPFQYQYQCSYVYMKYYASAFIYLSIFSAFGIPVYEMCMLFLYTHATPGTYWYYILNRYLPRILRPLETDPDKIPPRDIFRPYFDATKFFISQLTCLALILSLGVVSPPLAACLAVTMLATSAYTVLKIGRFLSNATAANQPKYIDLINEESRGVVTIQTLSRAFWLLLGFSCAFMAPFLFDVLGSTEGLLNAYWVLIVLPLLPLTVYIIVKMLRCALGYSQLPIEMGVNRNAVEGNSVSNCDVEMNSVVVSPMVSE